MHLMNKLDFIFKYIFTRNMIKNHIIMLAFIPTCLHAINNNSKITF